MKETKEEVQEKLIKAWRDYGEVAGEKETKLVRLIMLLIKRDKYES